MWPKKEKKNMKRKETIRFIVGNGVLAALTVVLTLISNNIPIAGVAINLALIPIAVAAVVYGPASGVFIGLVNGGLVMLSAAPFFAINAPATVLVCLLKSALAGLIASLIYNLLKNKNEHLGVVLSVIVVPIINTFVFIIGSLLFFGGVFGELITMFIGVNFIIEFIVNALLSPSIYYVIKVIKKKYA
jgi:uncharacterized membrane protein